MANRASRKQPCGIILAFLVLAASTSAFGASPEQIKTWITQLGSSFQDERKAAESSLSSVPPKDLAGPMTDALADENWEVRLAAARWLARISHKPAAPAVAKLLKDPIWSVRKQAADALSALRDPATEKALKDAMEDKNVAARTAIIAAYFQVSPSPDAEVVKACLEGADKFACNAALSGMANAWYNRRAVPAKSLLPQLIKLLETDDVSIAHPAAECLAAIGDAQAGPALLAAMRKRTGNARIYFSNALCNLKSKAMIPIFIDLLKEDASTRSSALIALDRLNAPEAAEPLATVLGDPTSDKYIRARVCLMLAGYASPKSIGPLCQVLQKDAEPAVRRTAAYALGRIGDAKAVEALADLLTKDDYPAPAPTPTPSPRSVASAYKLDPWAEKKTLARVEAAAALARIGGDTATAALRKAADHDQPQVRAMAIAGLAELGDKGAADMAIKGLADANYFVCAGAIEACQFLDDPRLVEPLIALVRSKRNAKTPVGVCQLGGDMYTESVSDETNLRDMAMKVLADKWPREAQPVLLECLGDSYSIVANDAATLLAQHNNTDAIPKLLEIVKASKLPNHDSGIVKALLQFKAKDAYEHLFKIVETNQYGLLGTAMGPLGEEFFLDDLKAQLADPKGMHYAALSVLAGISKPILIDQMLPYLEDKNGSIHFAVLRALGRPGCEKAVPALLEKLSQFKTINYNVSAREIIMALGNIGDKSAVPALLEALENDSADSRVMDPLFLALGKLGDARAYEPLVQRVSRNPTVAAEALSLLGDKRAVPVLQALAESNVPNIAFGKAIFRLQPDAAVPALDKVLRTYAVDAGTSHLEAIELLAKVGTKQAIESIRYATSDPSPAVRIAARKTLAAMKTPANTPSSAPAN